MDHFRRSLIRILVTTLFLLFIAWVAMKLMQNGNDLEGLLLEIRRTIDGWLRDILSMIDRITGILKPLIEKLTKAFNDAVRRIKQLVP